MPRLLFRTRLRLFAIPVLFLGCVSVAFLASLTPRAAPEDFDTISDNRLHGLLDIYPPFENHSADTSSRGKSLRGASLPLITLNDGELLVRVGEELLRKRPNNAADILTSAIEGKHGEDTVLLHKRAWIRAEVQRQAGPAIDDYIRIIQLEPKDSLAHYSLGVLRHLDLNVEAALADYSEAVSINAEFSYAYNNRGVLYKDLAFYSAALEDYGKAINLAPADPFPRFNRAVLHSQLRDFVAALSDFEAVLALSPNDTDAVAKLSRVRQHLDTTAP
eukprot:RCo008461